MRPVRFALVVLYAGYLVHVGLLLLILPWSEAWAGLLVQLPPVPAALLDLPALRGALSAFGVLHLGLVLAELRGLGQAARMHRTSPLRPGTDPTLETTRRGT